jgi:hypothetical protein
MVKGFATLVTGQRGMDPKSLLTFHIDLPQSLPLPRVKAFQDNLLQQLSTLQGVRSAALASGIPYSFYENSTALVLEEKMVAQEIRLRLQRQNRSALITLAPCTFLCAKAAGFMRAIPHLRFMLRL